MVSLSGFEAKKISTGGGKRKFLARADAGDFDISSMESTAKIDEYTTKAETAIAQIPNSRKTRMLANYLGVRAVASDNEEDAGEEGMQAEVTQHMQSPSPDAVQAEVTQHMQHISNYLKGTEAESGAAMDDGAAVAAEAEAEQPAAAADAADAATTQDDAASVLLKEAESEITDEEQQGGASADADDDSAEEGA